MAASTPSPLRTRCGAAAGVAAVVAATVLALSLDGKGGDSDSLFDVDAAQRHLERIADQPTPTGSEANAQARDYLVDELEALGLDTEVHEGLGSRTFSSSTASVTEVGVVDNVVATLPGHDSTERLVLAAHYDSVSSSPGAADDKQGVAVLLEVARVMTEEAAPRNDVVFLFTDAEEPGLLGASAFVDQHPYGADGGVVVNLEGAGNAGPSMPYHVSRGDGDLVRTWAQVAPDPVGSSGFVTAWQQADGFNTDFTALDEAGFRGIDFSPLDGRAYYHHPGDTVDNLDPLALEHQGQNALAMTQELSEQDLADSDTEDVVFFTLFGKSVVYPEGLALPLAALTLLGALALAVVLRIRAHTTVPRMAAGLGASVAVLAASAAAAWLLWQLLTLLQPGYAALASGEPYRPELYRWAVAALCLTLAWTAAALLRKRVDAHAVATGVAILLAAAGLGVALTAAGVAYLFTLPALFLLAGAAAALWIGPRRPVWQAAAWAGGAVPGAMLAAWFGMALLGMAGMGLAPLGVAFLGPAVLLLFPLLVQSCGPPSGRRRFAWAGPGVAVVTAMSLTALGLATDRFDDDHPHESHLAYIMDARSGDAYWVSGAADQDEWTTGYAAELIEADAPFADAPLLDAAGLRRSGPAEPTSLPQPQLEMRDSRTADDTTVMDLHVRSERDAAVLTVHLDLPVVEGEVRVDDRPAVAIASDDLDDDSEPWPYAVQLHNPPESGAELTIAVPGDAEPQLGVSDYTVGLEGLPEFQPRPSDVDLRPAVGSLPPDAVIVTAVPD